MRNADADANTEQDVFPGVRLTMEMIVWAFALMALGIVIVFAELFIPSGGLLAVMATACFVGSIVIAFLDGTWSGLMVLGVNTIVVPSLLFSAIRWWPHTPIGRLILVTPPEHPDDVLPETEAYRGLAPLIGMRGYAVSKMLPSGAVKIAGRTYDAISDGFAIEPGQLIEVFQVRTNRLVVRPANPSLTEPSLLSPHATPEADLARPVESLGLRDWQEPLT
jgi:membrane-bound ClpP family serine protease